MSLNHKIKSYFKYKLRAKNEYSLHSPFMFDLYNAVFKIARKRTNEFDAIEKLRGQLLKDNRTIPFEDLGAGAEKNRISTRTIYGITKKTGKKKKHARFLAHLAAYLNSKEILELGTSVGISTMYLSLKNKAAHITTIEGSKEIQEIASSTFKKGNFTNIESLQGNFDTLLPGLVAKKQYDFIYIDGNHTYDATVHYFELIKAVAGNETVIVFDDIYWSEGMTKAWEEICKDNSVTASVDLFEFGIVFFRKELSKQHFVLRY